MTFIFAPHGSSPTTNDEAIVDRLARSSARQSLYGDLETAFAERDTLRSGGSPEATLEDALDALRSRRRSPAGRQSAEFAAAELGRIRGTVERWHAAFEDDATDRAELARLPAAELVETYAKRLVETAQMALIARLPFGAGAGELVVDAAAVRCLRAEADLRRRLGLDEVATLAADDQFATSPLAWLDRLP